MTTLYELYDYLEKSDTETLIQQITDFTDPFSEQFGNGSKVRFLTHLNKIQNLHSVMKFQFEDENTESKTFNCFQKKEWVVDSTKMEEEMKDEDVSDRLTENPDNMNLRSQENTSDKYKKMDSGDIYFAGSILPYKTSYIRELCRKRLIPYEKPKGKYVFYRSKLEEWLKQNGSDHRLELLSIGKSVNRKRKTG